MSLWQIEQYKVVGSSSGHEDKELPGKSGGRGRNSHSSDCLIHLGGSKPGMRQKTGRNIKC